MKRSRAFKLVGLVFVAGAWLSLAQPAQADWWWGRGESWGHHQRARRPTFGIVVDLPIGATPIIVGESPYYYCRGRYYRPGPRGYVLVPAPVGAIVPSLPVEQRTIVMNGITYYEYDGVYYKGGPSGYTVVPIATPTAPSTINVASEPSTDQASQLTAPANTTLVINVPNKNGSYTPVTLQLAANGMYIGPQGEVYPTRPELSQLQSMYGK